ncbi:MAG TPA: hypothetical protein VF826_00105 [Chloroflexia bacterium]
MSNYLSDVTAKGLHRAEVVQPRLPSLYEPPGAVGGQPSIVRAAHGSDGPDFGAMPGTDDANPTGYRMEGPGAERSTANPPGREIATRQPVVSPDHQHRRQKLSPSVATTPQQPLNSAPPLPGPESATRHRVATPEPMQPQANTVEAHTEGNNLDKEDGPPRNGERPTPARQAAGETLSPRTGTGPATEQPPGGRGIDTQASGTGTQPPHVVARPHVTAAVRPVTQYGAGPVTSNIDGGPFAQPGARTVQPASGLARALPAGPAMPVTPSPAPSIQVTIGRIEVRATASQQPGDRARSTGPAPQPTLSLADYLKQRARGER